MSVIERLSLPWEVCLTTTPFNYLRYGLLAVISPLPVLARSTAYKIIRKAKFTICTQGLVSWRVMLFRIQKCEFLC